MRVSNESVSHVSRLSTINVVTVIVTVISIIAFGFNVILQLDLASRRKATIFLIL